MARCKSGKKHSCFKAAQLEKRNTSLRQIANMKNKQVKQVEIAKALFDGTGMQQLLKPDKEPVGPNMDNDDCTHQGIKSAARCLDMRNELVPARY